MPQKASQNLIEAALSRNADATSFRQKLFNSGKGMSLDGNSSDAEIAHQTLRHVAMHGRSDGDRVRAAVALTEKIATTVEGLVQMAAIAGIGPAELLEGLRKYAEGDGRS